MCENRVSIVYCNHDHHHESKQSEYKKKKRILRKRSIFHPVHSVRANIQKKNYILSEEFKSYKMFIHTVSDYGTFGFQNIFTHLIQIQFPDVVIRVDT